MLSEQETRLNEILRRIAESLDISPTDYERAVQSYGAVGTWLEDGFVDDVYGYDFFNGDEHVDSLFCGEG